MIPPLLNLLKVIVSLHILSIANIYSTRIENALNYSIVKMIGLLPVLYIFSFQ